MLTLFRAFPTINEIFVFVMGPHQIGSASTNQSRILQVDDRYSQKYLLDDSGAKFKIHRDVTSYELEFKIDSVRRITV